MSSFYGNREPSITEADKDLAKQMETGIGASSSGNMTKNVLMFYKIHNPVAYPQVKLQLEIGTFLEIADRYDGAYTNGDIRHAIMDGARRLRHELSKEKNAQLITPEAKHDLLAKLDKVQEGIRAYELSMSTSSSAMKEWSLGSPEVKVTLKPIEEVKSTDTLSIKALKKSQLIDCSDLFAKEIAPDNLNSSLAERLERCRKLYNKGDYATLETLLVDTAFKLPKANVFDPKPDQLAEVHKQVMECSRYLFGVNLPCSPLYLRQML